MEVVDGTALVPGPNSSFSMDFGGVRDNPVGTACVSPRRKGHHISSQRRDDLLRGAWFRRRCAVGSSKWRTGLRPHLRARIFILGGAGQKAPCNLLRSAG